MQNERRWQGRCSVWLFLAALVIPAALAGCGKSSAQQRAENLAISEKAEAAAKADLDAYQKRLREIAGTPMPQGSVREERAER